MRLIWPTGPTHGQQSPRPIPDRIQSHSSAGSIPSKLCRPWSARLRYLQMVEPSRALRYAEEPDLTPNHPALRSTSETGLGILLFTCISTARVPIDVASNRRSH